MARVTPIAVDGPVASGKTAVGRLLSRKLGYRFLDTGIMYRALTWLALERGVDPGDADGLVAMAKGHELGVVFGDDEDARILVDDQDVTPNLWRQEVDQAVSLVSRVAGIRELLVDHQRRIAAEGAVVMVGRDVGTVVLPDAPLKLFLIASKEERARRRYEELKTVGQGLSYEQVLSDLERRDRLDTEREVGPLRPATDACVMATDDLSLDEVVEMVLAKVGRE
ncbi:MAG: (d)CMP kinase [Chloroflexi bacterium]|nr:(d)CMP kinase [Chloroflexota bacterium]